MTKLNVIFLGFTIPDSVAESVFKIDPNPAIQTHKFAWSFTRSLAKNYNVFLISSIPVQNFPLVPKLFFKAGSFHQDNVKGFFIPFVNYVLIKHLTRLIFGLIFLTYFIITKKPKMLFVHGVHTPFLILAALFRVFGLKFSVVLTDPAGVELATDGFLSRNLKKIDRKLTGFWLRRADLIVSLAESLIGHYKISSPYVVFPGILNEDFRNLLDIPPPVDNCNSQVFKIIYAGGLHEIYGIKNLVNAVNSLSNEIQLEMIFFGKGDQVENIILKSTLDHRIKYGGFLNNESLISNLLGADLLINPRPACLDFASLSFPSKLIEYLATGIPVLTTDLKTIPPEYRSFFYYIEDESATGIQKALIDVMEKDPNERLYKAHLAKQFVYKNLSETAIAAKLECVVTSIFNR